MTFMQPAALIFDLDGTLADTMPAHLAALRSVIEPQGLYCEEERFYQLAGVPSQQVIALLAREQGRTVDSIALAAAKEAAFAERLDEIEPLQPVLEIARAARGRLRLAVATGAIRPIAGRVLDRLGVADWFDALVTAEDTTRHKPAPDVFLEAARRLEVAPPACIVYEDADLGLEAAHAAGMQAIDVRPMLRTM